MAEGAIIALSALALSPELAGNQAILVLLFKVSVFRSGSYIAREIHTGLGSSERVRFWRLRASYCPSG